MGLDAVPAQDGPANVPATHWLELMARISPVGVFQADERGLCIFVNARWCELTGLSAEEAVGHGWEKALHPDDLERIRREWGAVAAGGAPFKSEYRYQRRDGAVVWVLGQVAEDRAACGTLRGFIGVITDITELRQTREELQRSRNDLEERVRERTRDLRQMALVVEASDDAIITSDLAGRIVSWNAAAEKMFGYRAEEMIGQTTLMVTPEELKAEAIELKARVRRGEAVLQHETTRLRRNGQRLEMSLSILPLREDDGRVVGTSAIIRDITVRKQAERSLHQLSWRLLRVQDEERRRMARDLHDSTTQTLAALVLNLHMLSKTQPESEDECRRMLADSIELAQQAVSELRTHSYLLHPPLLDERGLCAAIRWLVEGFGVRSGIAVTLDLDACLPRLESAAEMALFRVAQEGLSNVRRHSKSPTTRISLRAREASVVLEICDQGCGLPAGALESPGVGIAGMKERLLELGGMLTVESSGSGTALRAVLPRTT